MVDRPLPYTGSASVLDRLQGEDPIDYTKRLKEAVISDGKGGTLSIADALKKNPVAMARLFNSIGDLSDPS